MRVGTTNTGKKFVVDRARYLAHYQGVPYYVTAAGNVVGENPDGTFQEIAKAAAETHILLMPYEIAKELFPANPALVETI